MPTLERAQAPCQGKRWRSREIRVVFASGTWALGLPFASLSMGQVRDGMLGMVAKEERTKLLNVRESPFILLV